MKIVLVEDEIMARNGICTMIKEHTRHTLCGVAANGLLGYQMVKEQRPDLVITDIRMPQMSGLEMIEKLRQEKCGADFIILSGYSDFEYAKEAIRLGAMDYLVKPVMLESLVESINEVEHKKYDQASYIPSAEVMMEQLMRDEKNSDAVRQLSWILQIPLDKPCAVALLHLNHCRKKDESYREFQKVIREKADELCFNVMKIVELPPEYGVLCIVSDAGPMSKFKNLMVKYLFPDIKKERDCTIAYGEIRSLSEISGLAGQLRQMMLFEEKGSSQVLMEALKDRKPGEERGQVSYPYQMEQEVKMAVFHYDREGFCREAEKLYDYFLTNAAGNVQLKEWLMRFWSMIGIQFYEFFGKASKKIFDKLSLRDIMGAVSGKELRDAFEQMEKSVCQFFLSYETKQSYGELVQKAMGFIENHYGELIDQKEMAAWLGVTPEYLSSKFSRETGSSFSSYIKKYRIRQAKYFLINSDRKIQEIGALVGYQDAAYFNKLFRAECGVTPLEYRKQYRRGEG